MCGHYHNCHTTLRLGHGHCRESPSIPYAASQCESYTFVETNICDTAVNPASRRVARGVDADQRMKDAVRILQRKKKINKRWWMSNQPAKLIPARSSYIHGQVHVWCFAFTGRGARALARDRLPQARQYVCFNLTPVISASSIMLDPVTVNGNSMEMDSRGTSP
jgi:hypothetical protein